MLFKNVFQPSEIIPYQDLGNKSGTINFTQPGVYSSFTATGNCTLNFSAATGQISVYYVEITNGAAYTMTLPDLKTEDGAEIIFSSNPDLLTFIFKGSSTNGLINHPIKNAS